MLRASVSLSRKLSRDFNSTGFGVTLEGEIPFPSDDSEGVLERVSELFHLAEEALAIEMERNQGKSSTDQCDEKPSSVPAISQPKPVVRSAPLPINRPAYGNEKPISNGSSSVNELATQKQQQYLQNLGKRKGLKSDDLAAVINQVIGSPKKLTELTKREAGTVIDHLNNGREVKA